MAYNNSVFDFSYFEESEPVSVENMKKNYKEKIKQERAGNKADVAKIVSTKNLETDNQNQNLRTAVKSTVKAFMITFVSLAVFFPVLGIVSAEINHEMIIRERKQIETLIDDSKSEKVQLTAQINTVLQISFIDDYAEKVLGMTNQGSGNVKYFDFSMDDEVVTSGGRSYSNTQNESFFAKMLSYIFK